MRKGEKGLRLLGMLICLTLLFLPAGCGKASGRDGLSGGGSADAEIGQTYAAGEQDESADRADNDGKKQARDGNSGDGAEETSSGKAAGQKRAAGEPGEDEGKSEGSTKIQDGKPLEITDRGCRIFHTEYGVSFVYFAVRIHNPNENYAVSGPRLILTAKNAEGNTLMEEEQTLGTVAAGDTVLYGSSVTYEGDAAETVDIAVKNEEDAYRKSPETVRQEELAISGAKKKENAQGADSFVGEVKNNSRKDLQSVRVNVVYKSGGEIVGGDSVILEDLKKGAAEPFEIGVLSRFDEYDSWEIRALSGD